MLLASRPPLSSDELPAYELDSESASVRRRAARCGRLLERARARLGSVLCGKWRLDAVIGVGGTATVFAATHRRHGSRAAIKLAHSELAPDAGRREELLREAVLANRVGHPGVVRVLDDDVADDGAPFLVTELLHGETLHARWVRAGHTMDAGEVVPILEALLEVVAAVHDQGVVHRDIKPKNVFLTRDGRVKLLDFGIAFEPAAPSQYTRVGAIVGTPSYMAPEQAGGRTWQVDARSDVWSVGAVAFVLLSGRRVHMGGSALETIAQASTYPAPPLWTVAPHVPKGIAAIVERALAFDRADRWHDAESMRCALRQSRPAAPSHSAFEMPHAAADGACLEDSIDSEPRSGERRRAAPWEGPTLVSRVGGLAAPATRVSVSLAG